ncbi:MAG: DNA-binding protein [Eubacteriales bacterium]
MSNVKFITSAEVAEELGVSKSQAYKVVRKLNEELESRGFLVVAGKVSRQFFEERFYGLKEGVNVCV